MPAIAGTAISAVSYLDNTIEVYGGSKVAILNSEVTTLVSLPWKYFPIARIYQYLLKTFLKFCNLLIGVTLY